MFRFSFFKATLATEPQQVPSFYWILSHGFRWYSSATLGLFIHWGISSVGGQCDLSWGMKYRADGAIESSVKQHGIYAAQTPMSPTKYWSQAEEFLCKDYDPHKWVSAAKEAGFEYAAITTKHHDGFCLWPSAFGDFNTSNFLNGRDLLGEFVQACRDVGLKIGFYFSPPDFYFWRKHMNFGCDNKATRDMYFQPYDLPERTPEELEAYRVYTNGQVHELITRYGTIDILWFDGRMPPGSMTVDDIRAIQPGILINPRGYGYGDFDTPECKFPEERMTPGWWEYCHVFSDGAWGYMEHEAYKPIGWFLDEYSKARAWDGKFLPNVGPDANGRLPEAYYARMRQLKEWMAHSSEAVIDTTGGQWPEFSDVPVTHRDGKTYALMSGIHGSDTVSVSGFKEAPKSVKLLRTGEPVAHHFVLGKAVFTIPVDSRTQRTDVIVIE